MAKAEELLRAKLAKFLRGDDVVYDEIEDKKTRTVVHEDGTTEEVEEVVGVLRLSVPLQTLADNYRDILEDDTNYPYRKLAALKGKKFKDAKGKEINPGWDKVWQKLEEKGVDL
jgi:hypothetical protein